MSTLRLKTGDLKVSVSSSVASLVTGGVGSCVVVCIWDSSLKVGGMAHMCMPRGMGDLLRPGTAPDTAIPRILSLLEKQGASFSRLQVTLAGGGNMFKGSEVGGVHDVGHHIARTTLDVLLSLGLKVRSRSLGGHVGRSVELHLDSGDVHVRFTDGSDIQFLMG